jgi:hypothetical protein
MAENITTTDNGQATEDARVALALQLLADQERKDAEKEAKRLARQAEKAAKGEQPNAAHAFLHTIVRAFTQADRAFPDDADAYRAEIRRVLGFVDTAAQMGNTTTANDFRVIGQLIATTMPKVPVAPKADGK